MIPIIETAFALIIIFGVLVVFHEFGHFIAAKLVGIRVDEFAVGFGPKLITLFKRGDTEYTVHPYPLGGFVKLAGMEPGEEDIPDGYQAQPTWKRAVTIFAGPFASFVLAVLVFVGLGVFAGFPDGGNPQNRVGTVFPGTEAQKIGLRTGDRILAVNGQKVTTGEQMIDFIAAEPGEKVDIKVRRNGKTLVKTGTPRWAITYLGALWSFQKPGVGVVDELGKTSAAGNAGIKKGDELVSIDGKPIGSGQEMVKAIEANRGDVELTLRRNKQEMTVKAEPAIQRVEFTGIEWTFPGGYVSELKGSAKNSGLEIFDVLASVNGKKINSGAKLEDILRDTQGNPVTLRVERGEETKSIKLNPTQMDYASIEASFYKAEGKFGFFPEPGREKMGFTASVKQGLASTWGIAEQLIQTLTSSRIKEDVGGPIMIARMTYQQTQLGPYFLVLTLGMLSMSLAFINLIPIPVLDGGHLAILAIESIRRKRLTREQMATVQMIGLAIIVMLVIVVFTSDIAKIVSGQVYQ